VTETLENEPIEPDETVETEPRVKFVVEPEENQGKQLSMILDPLNLIGFGYLTWVYVFMLNAYPTFIH
jgi:hypothetical protein